MGRGHLPNSWWTIGAAAVLALGGGAPLAAQAGDGARWVQAAHAAQRDFEATRRAHLPWTRAASGGRCDEHIGRFCYWHGETPDSAPPERPAIVRARTELLGLLDSASRAAPGDGWIAGQRVRYRLEAGSPAAAQRVAAACGADAWWCDALRGLALHADSRFVAAAMAFDRALAEMPDSTRCRWTDLTPLLDGRAADRYAHADCDARAPLNARLWWLAQPFYALPFNDRRTEHFARRTMIEIAGHSAWPETSSWGDDLAELILRYGWPRWFERVEPDSPADPSYSVMGHDPQPSFAFFPDGRLLDSVYSARATDWEPDARRAASRYAPAYATFVRPVPVLLSRFRRGDSAVIVAGYSAGADTLLRSIGLRAALAVAPDERQRFVTWDSSAAATGGLAVVAPQLPALVDLDLFDDTHRVAARARQAISPMPRADGPQISDILLFRPADEAPRTLWEAVPRAMGTAESAADRQLGLYWELYGIRMPGTPLDVSLTIQRTGESWWHHARRFLHLGRGDAPIALHWQDAARPVNGTVGRSVAVDLSRLDGGDYRIRIRIRIDGGPALVRERQFAIRR